MFTWSQCKAASLQRDWRNAREQALRTNLMTILDRAKVFRFAGTSLRFRLNKVITGDIGGLEDF